MKFKPHPYQQYCIDRLVSDRSAGLFLDMGLGKTIITLSAIADLKYNRFQIDKVLVIAPKKVAEATWVQEAGKWEHTRMLRVSTVLGSEKQRLRALDVNADVYVINRENVVWLVEHYKNAWPFDMVVIDELSSFKNPSAKRFKALKHMLPHIDRIVGLTGTPAPNSMLDLWSEIYLLDQGKRLGKFVTHYRDAYFEPDKRSYERIFSWKPKKGADEVIRQKIADICISMKSEDYLQLPDLIEHEVPVVLDPKARKAYEKLEKDMFLELEDSELDAGTAAVLTGKLLQMANGAVYTEDRDVVHVHDAKLDAMTELMEALSGKPVLCFYNFQHDRDRLMQRFPEAQLLTDPSVIDAWNRGEVQMLLAHPASAAYGLNLQQGGNHVVWFGLTWSLELYQQANKRLHRQGQSEKVVVHHLVAKGTRDEAVLRALSNKDRVQEELLASLKARIEEVTGKDKI